MRCVLTLVGKGIAAGRCERPGCGGFVLLVAGAMAAPALAQQGVFELGTVVVTGKEQASIQTAEQVMGSETIEALGQGHGGAAVAVLPGASLSRNSRNEDMNCRAYFDARQVPVLYIDGVPLYRLYDGYVDLGALPLSTWRRSAWPPARIADVRAQHAGGRHQPGSRKPVRALEGSASAGFASGSEKELAVNLGGGNQGSWYYQLGASYLDADSFPLPHGFKDFKVKPTDTGSRRENAYRTDQRLSLLGITPNATDEYALGYVRQDGERATRGTPASPPAASATGAGRIGTPTTSTSPAARAWARATCSRRAYTAAPTAIRSTPTPTATR